MTVLTDGINIEEWNDTHIPRNMGDDIHIKYYVMCKIDKFILVCLLFAISLCSCTSIMCGELTGEWKQQVDDANKKAIDFKIRHVPCEFRDIDMVFLTGKIDTVSVHSVHKILYNEKNKIGWQVIRVYNKDNKYLFSHRYTDSIYVQSVD